jgi:hypothetical protein
VSLDFLQKPGFGPIMSSPLQTDFMLSQDLHGVATTGGLSKNV